MFSNKSKGQAAIEYLMVFGIALALSTPFIIRAQSSIIELRAGSNTVEMYNSMNKLESSIKTVDASGKPAKRTFMIELPSNVESVDVNTNTIVYNLSTTDGYSQQIRSFEIDLTGDLPESQGNHRVSVTAKSDSVELAVVP